MGKIKNDILINIILNRKPLTYNGRTYWLLNLALSSSHHVEVFNL
jgi:hypothetical protein